MVVHLPLSILPVNVLGSPGSSVGLDPTMSRENWDIVAKGHIGVSLLF